MHSGGHQIAEPGARERGGRPPTNGLYVRHLREERVSAFHGAKPGTLEGEIKLAKAMLDWATQQFELNPGGGQTVSVTTDEKGRRHVTIRPWSDIMLSHQDRVVRLEAAFSAMKKIDPASVDDLETYEEWLKSAADEDKS